MVYATMRDRGSRRGVAGWLTAISLRKNWYVNYHAEWLEQYGYAGLFITLVVGIVAWPTPEETALMFSGYLVYRGTFQWLPTCITGFLGCVCGITLSYVLGWTLGLRTVRHFGHWLRVDERKLERVRGWFDRAGKWLLPVSYFIPGVRHLVALVAGGSRLRWQVFALFAYGGAFVWSQTFIAIGYCFGPAWTVALRVLMRHRWAVTIAIAAILLLALLVRFGRRRSSSEGSES
jgi:membrane protein DedA with SNARE-associated domain